MTCGSFTTGCLKRDFRRSWMQSRSIHISMTLVWGRRRARLSQRHHGHNRLFCIDADRSFSSAVRRLREQSQLKLGRSPEMWITEWGFAVGQKVKNGVILSEDMVAAFVPR